jgi:Brp/Blh family beta-carotene 15,15'-monooxygenase
VWLVDVAETAILALYFALVPPVLAVGLYFCLWHATRHVARSSCSTRRAPRSGGWVGGARLVRFARDSAPLTVAALVLLLGLYLVVPPETSAAPSSLLALTWFSSRHSPCRTSSWSLSWTLSGLWRDSSQAQQKPSN